MTRTLMVEADDMLISTTVPRLSVMLLLALVGGLLGAGILYFDSAATAVSQLYLGSPQFGVWLSIYATMFALYAVIFLPLWRQIGYFKAYYHRWKEVGITTCLIIALALIPDTFAARIFHLPQAFPLQYQAIKALINVVTGLIAIALPAAILFSFILVALHDMLRIERLTTDHIRSYGVYRDLVNILLLIFGVYIGLGVLSTAAIRQSLITTGLATQQTFPTLLVLLYGAYFTVLLVVVYIPVYAALVATKHHIIECFVSLPDPASDTWHDSYTKRKAFEEYLQLGVSPTQSFQTGFAVLTPLLSGMIPLILGQ